jgi:hypothetical protein
VNPLRTLLAAVALLVLAACPAGAGAALVPPGNSAANQYTETFPTTGGNAEAKGKGKVTPGDVLGSRNAKKLDSAGKRGREAAAVVAATAPPAAIAPAEGGGDPGAGGGGDPGAGGGGAGAAPTGGAGEDGSATGSGSGPGLSQAVAEGASGSSGFSEVLGQATGSSSSGGTGLLLPLIVLASTIGALVFFLRRRRPTA